MTSSPGRVDIRPPSRRYLGIRCIHARRPQGAPLDRAPAQAVLRPPSLHGCSSSRGYLGIRCIRARRPQGAPLDRAPSPCRPPPAVAPRDLPLPGEFRGRTLQLAAAGIRASHGTEGMQDVMRNTLWRPRPFAKTFRSPPVDTSESDASTPAVRRAHNSTERRPHAILLRHRSTGAPPRAWNALVTPHLCPFLPPPQKNVTSLYILA